eukprot:GHVR01118957.1.p1 GENE.GHVR01118957.1~~GHVR01118957.1.p1  ORF type:complete len:207 (+),score=81.94 GHVR01118957.1:732-1352(+)
MTVCACVYLCVCVCVCVLLCVCVCVCRLPETSGLGYVADGVADYFPDFARPVCVRLSNLLSRGKVTDSRMQSHQNSPVDPLERSLDMRVDTRGPVFPSLCGCGKCRGVCVCSGRGSDHQFIGGASDSAASHNAASHNAASYNVYDDVYDVRRQKGMQLLQAHMNNTHTHMSHTHIGNIGGNTHTHSDKGKNGTRHNARQEQSFIVV